MGVWGGREIVCERDTVVVVVVVVVIVIIIIIIIIIVVVVIIIIVVVVITQPPTRADSARSIRKKIRVSVEGGGESPEDPLLY